MKIIIQIFTACIFSLPVIAQNDQSNLGNELIILNPDYNQIHHFIILYRNNPEIIFTVPKKEWSSRSAFKLKIQRREPVMQRKKTTNDFLYDFLEQKKQWSAELAGNLYSRIARDWKKEFAPTLIYDNRFVAHSIPASYGTQNYQWVPNPQPKYNLGEDIITTVIGSFLGVKTDQYNRNGYFTPSGIKY